MLHVQNRERQDSGLTNIGCFLPFYALYVLHGREISTRTAEGEE